MYTLYLKNKMKKKFRLECQCGKIIIGFSDHHVRQNLRLHQLISNEHKERIELLKRFSNIIITKGMSIDEINEVLSNHPLIREDIKAIGSLK